MPRGTTERQTEGEIIRLIVENIYTLGLRNCLSEVVEMDLYAFKR